MQGAWTTDPMAEHGHLDGREACPFLPPARTVLRPRDVSAARKAGGANAYLAALECAQSLWLQGLPAQAILQLNHAMAHDLAAGDLQWPMPYQALVWILTRRHEDGFLGNPVRHFQHLATRMGSPGKRLRTARAWVCFHLAESVLPADAFPRDQRQIENERLAIPDASTCTRALPSPEEQKLVQLLLS